MVYTSTAGGALRSAKCNIPKSHRVVIWTVICEKHTVASEAANADVHQIEL